MEYYDYMECLGVIQAAATRLSEIDLEIELTASAGYHKASALLREDKEAWLDALLQGADRVRELSRTTNA